jgi:hypothetical protein
MARYIDADKLIQRLEREVESCKDPSKGSAQGFKMAIFIAQTLPDEQVAPRAVVDALKLEVENEILKRERQRQILNHYALQYGTVRDQQAVIDKAKSEVAWEIFAEIERLMFDGLIGGKYPAKVIAPEKYAELKKKYTGGE